jgi:hypothetical protein
VIATRLTDALLGEVVSVAVDKKFFEFDRFDDLTTVSLNEIRERVQIKNRESNEPLPISTFTTDRRSLKLDAVIRSVIADRDGPGANASAHRYRIILGDSAPTDPALTDVLLPAKDDPGPFIPGMATLRFQFDQKKLWPNSAAEVEAAERTFAGQMLS